MMNSEVIVEGFVRAKQDTNDVEVNMSYKDGTMYVAMSVQHMTEGNIEIRVRKKDFVRYAGLLKGEEDG